MPIDYQLTSWADIMGYYIKDEFSRDDFDAEEVQQAFIDHPPEDYVATLDEDYNDIAPT